MAVNFSREFPLRLNELRINGEFTDVTIECADSGDRFKCHRLALVAASDFFKTMFTSNFGERFAPNIVLRGVSTATFREVLEFIYTGDAKIEHDSFWDMFLASQYLLMASFERYCVLFLSSNRNHFTVNDFMNAYSYACAHLNGPLLAVLVPQIAAQLESFTKSGRFLEWPLDALEAVLFARRRSSTLPSTTDAVFSAILRWVVHSPLDRFQYHEDLIRLVRIENISPQFNQFLNDISPEMVDPLVLQFPASIDLVPVIPAVGDVPKTLHLYVRYASENVIRIFSALSTKECAPAGEIFKNDSDQAFTTVAVNDSHLFRLHCLGGTGKIPNAIDQTFFAHTSADMQISVPVKRPPVLFERVNLCAIRSDVYAYHETLPSDPIRTVANSQSRTFDDQEIDRGIFAYSWELDKWYPMPPMKRRVRFAGMTSLDSTLYVIGGCSVGDRTSSYAQAYGSREGSWRELPKPYNNFYEHAAACSLHGKIYVIDLEDDYVFHGRERYGLVAGRWEFLSALVLDGSPLNSKAVSYSCETWLLSRDVIPAGTHRLHFRTGMDSLSDGEVYSWAPTSLDLKFESPTNMVDCVVFREG